MEVRDRWTNQVGHITVIARVARDLWQRKQTLSSGSALGLGSFTAINPWPRAITITYNQSRIIKGPIIFNPLRLW